MCIRDSFGTKMIVFSGGLFAWAAHFLAIYIYNALACARRFHHVEIASFPNVPVVVAAMTAGGLIACAWLGWRAYAWRGALLAGEDRANDTNRFLRYVAIGNTLLAGVAIVWQGLFVLVVPPCGP